MDSDVTKELEDQLRQLSSAVGDLNSSITGTIRSTQSETNAINKNVVAADKSGKALESLAAGADKYEQSMASLTKSFAMAGSALASFAKTIVSGTDGFSKYGDSIKQFGGALSEMGDNFGPLGKIFGTVANAASKLAPLYLAQADNLLKASDAFARMGAAATLSTKEIQKIGLGSGLASSQLDKLIKPIQSVQGGLLGLGESATGGIKKFGQLAAVSEDVRREFKRLGMGDQERNQSLADFITLMNKSGASFQGSLKTQQGLQKAALEYTRNLYELAEITGKDVDTVKAQQEAAMSTMEVALEMNKLDQQRIDAARRGDKNEVARLEAQEGAIKRFTNELQKGGATQAQIVAAQNQFLTGAITGQSAKFAIMGLNMDEFIKKTKDGTLRQGELANAYKTSTQNTINTFSHQTLGLSKNLQDLLGLTSESVGGLTQRAGIDFEKSSKQAQDELIANKNNESIAALDKAQQARNDLTELERKATTTLDNLLLATNPIINVDLHLASVTEALTSITKTLTDNFGMLSKAVGFAAGATVLGALSTSIVSAVTSLRAAGLISGGGGAGLLGRVVGFGGRLLAGAGLAAGAGYALNAGAGAIGIGKDGHGDDEEDADNWKRMNLWQHIESGAARGTEKAARLLFMDNFADAAQKERIKTETEALTQSGQIKIPKSKMKDSVSVASSKDSKGVVSPFEVKKYLMDKGLSDIQATGILANIHAESGFNPGISGDDGTSGGLFQHHDGKAKRFSDMKAFAGPDWKTNWKKQIDFALTEPEMKKFRNKNVATAKDAARAFVADFEMPANKDEQAEKRAAYTDMFEGSPGAVASKNSPLKDSMDSGNTLLFDISQKLDRVISELNDGNDTSKKLLQHAKV